VADKQRHLQFTTIDEAPIHGAKGMGIWSRARKEEMKNAILDTLQYAHTEGADRPEVTNWRWPS
jgi:phosphoketolase